MSKIEHFKLSKLLQDNNISSDNVAKDKKSAQGQLSKLYAVSDLSALLLIFMAVSFTSNITQILSFFIVSIGVLAWFERNGHYRMRMPFWTEVKTILNTIGFALLADSFLEFNTKLDSSRLLVIASWVCAAVALVGFRMFVRKVAIKQDNFQIPTLLIGSGITAQHAQSSIESAPEMGYKITAHIKNLPEVFLQYGSSWADLCADYGVQHVVLALEGKDLQGTEKIIAKLMRQTISFSVVPPLPNIPVTSMVPQYFLNHNTMLLTHDSGHKQYLPKLVKRSVDILVSGTALILLSPVILVVAAIIKLDGGDAFFGHKRLGLEGKVFPCLKFRSMVMGGDKILKKHLEENPEAAAEWKATQKLQNDPRVTRLGKLLRATSIDELPQLINVLKGDMSLVGPRPIVRDEVVHYNHDIAYYYRVRPGVTGLWQVSGRNDVSYAQRVQMDSWYVRNWSLWHDITIICKTFPAVFKRSGAY